MCKVGNIDDETRGQSDVIRIWDLNTGEEVQSVKDSVNIVSLAWSPDGTQIASQSDIGDVDVWNARTGAPARSLFDGLMSLSGNSLAFGSDGKTLACSGFASGWNVHLWDISTGRTIANGLTANRLTSWAVLSPDGMTVAESGSDKSIDLSDISSGRLLQSLTIPDNVTGSAFSADGATFAAACKNQTIEIWDVRSGGLVRSLSGSAADVVALAFSPDCSSLVTTGAGDAIDIWSLSSGKLSSRIQGAVNHFTAVAFSPDGKTLASADCNALDSPDETINFWDIATGEGFRPFADHAGPVFYMQFSSDCLTLETGDSGSNRCLWDIATARNVRTVPGFVNAPAYNAVSPDGSIIAHSGIDPGFILSSHETGTEEFDVDLPNEAAIGLEYIKARRRYSVISNRMEYPRDPVLTGHVFPVGAIAFSPDGKSLVSGDRGGIVKIWDVPGAAERHTLTGHAAPVYSVAFSGDGRFVASASYDGSIKIWDAAAGSEIATLYEWANRDSAIVSPDGRFDTGNLDNIVNLHWVLPDQPFATVPVEAFFRQYYTPGLFAHLMHGDPLPPIPDISKINHVQPVVTINQIAPHPGADRALVDVTVSYSGQRADAVLPNGSIHSEMSGVYDLRLFRNGQLVGALPEDNAPGAESADLVEGTIGKTYKHTFTVRLARDGSKSVKFTAYAFNGSQVKSLTAAWDYTLPNPLPAVKGRAWILAFGANAYDDPTLFPDLHYSVADALAYGTAAVPRMKQTGEYAQVTFVPMVSDCGPADPNVLPASKAALRAVLRALAGKAPDEQDAPFASPIRKMGVTQAEPEDTLLIAFSCHGDTDSRTGEYYLFPAHLGATHTDWPDRALAKQGVSSAELTAWLQDVDAGQMAMVIDSCHSAAAAGQQFKPGPMDSPGLGQLAYYKRMRILSASAADSEAKEYSDLGHGLLTAALLDDALVRGDAKPDHVPGPLTFGPWLTYAKLRVPDLDAQEHGAVLQSGRKGTIDVTAISASPRSVNALYQEPILFDFHRQDSPDAAVAPGP